MDSNKLWLLIGFSGQLLFTSRFLVQWIASERAKRSIVPLAFWWFSLAGGATLLAYALWRRDPVFAVGQASGLVIYTRNLMLIGKDRRAAKDSA
ncbi:MAG TPA: lipid-A-disaccharide synthase N-terminal domain-containing protein [Paracoccus sp. (in: a-proteobacteria)]|uniref:lipid-A-disaccharide synthase N-terminal domain-containing protein n=1 Tax=uncultured Paracoccus sp. TaxID=189685 RepID=UPI002639694C|nr:lipid-A-disaccharide synthase N-terminal domain-containing protein [uncultured Paracoccus sp.]HMQ39796.1 lipid-A-disaccharide synthase N-terminal domain-containing protein [Paracoccus sp. (in: a-proteobacteria)]HMR35338.1 lipid-A-disaccharide synthase N-terminal domain-containing protein [Paracoccus sp. (in: a-proteobacteria)]